MVVCVYTHILRILTRVLKVLESAMTKKPVDWARINALSGERPPSKVRKYPVDWALRTREPNRVDVRLARNKLGFSMKEAAELVFVTEDMWYNWERPVEHHRHKTMPAAYAQLFALKTGLTSIDDICPHLSKLNGKD